MLQWISISHRHRSAVFFVPVSWGEDGKYEKKQKSGPDPSRNFSTYVESNNVAIYSRRPIAVPPSLAAQQPPKPTKERGNPPMPRKQRIWFPGAKYHVTTRGVRQSNIFHDSEDYKMYLYTLLEAKKKYPFHLHAYCLMSNHTHLQIETTQTNISRIMHHINTVYAIYMNRKYNYTGHLFQGRYGEKPIKDPIYEIEVSKYIHLNPVAANLVTKPEDYPWSSYQSYLYNRKNDPLVTTSHILQYFTKPSSGSYAHYIQTPNTRIYFSPERKVKFLILKK
ncbi:transposase [Sutcliffiella deserti]|uniref:transposase n=1 Tax=Sutcliffiella deserti TaxID=2875501 RepID=UPI001CBFF0D8|nr:transposase [Sutcliffiella deserti]